MFLPGRPADLEDIAARGPHGDLVRLAVAAREQLQVEAPRRPALPPLKGPGNKQLPLTRLLVREGTYQIGSLL